MQLYCTPSCCPYDAKCGNSLEESTKVYLARNTRTLQLSVVAVEDIDAGEVLGQYLGEFEHRGQANPIRVAVNAAEMGGLMRFVNHSCSPVAQFVEVANGRRTTVIVATTEVVREGEEITVDYGGDLWFVCRCGLPSCRHHEIQDQRDPARCCSAPSEAQQSTSPELSFSVLLPTEQPQAPFPTKSSSSTPSCALSAPMAKLTGSTNYKFTEVQRLLSLVAKFLPLGKDEWERLASSYNSNRGRGIAEQDYESLRRKFKMLYKIKQSIDDKASVEEMDDGADVDAQEEEEGESPQIFVLTSKHVAQPDTIDGTTNFDELLESAAVHEGLEAFASTPRPPPGHHPDPTDPLNANFEPEKSSVGRSRRTAESKGYISTPNRLGGGNLAAFRETIDRKRGADDDDDLHEASYAKSDLENTSGAMGINIVELMILMREDTERRDEVRRAEEEQRRCDDILAREMRYNAEKKKAEERRRQEKLETEERSRRDKEEACARSQELMPFISALVKKE
ncbi:hypothetical protein PPTG_23464 [Phytophthora nicotianae INRA-310]|uniref:SET domain-containing protein n=1 Tax=Phytophthora nicotianae (strain INRA-310) TaxID=761204 RepID=W2Q075_PHYN3|nr:hypothetical protein PPTG_23464 [Phytophthora nicotianae INRA-310]ETN05914.1 hypothetical protein PPTG_23464 [Phytophthora nicotianae INRA-310]